MYGMPSTPQDPMASYEVKADMLYLPQHPGTRGYGSLPDLLTTGLIANNNSLVLQSKWARPKIGAIAVQFGVLGPSAPLALFENGTPATLKLNPSQGYQLAATFPGLRGNQMSLTVNLPRPYPANNVTTPLVVQAIPPGQIVVTLATTGHGQNTIPTVTTTPALLVAALQANPGISKWVTAWADGTTAAVLSPLPLTYFMGGMDVPFLEYVSLNANASLVIQSTATQVANLLKGSKFVGATNNGASTGAGAVTAFGPLALTGGRLSAGAILDEDADKIKRYQFHITLGQGIEHMDNYGLQVPLGRFAAGRTWKVVPTQTLAIMQDVRSTVGGTPIVGVNHSMEHGPRSLFL